jgi:hypothetical protein
MTGVRRGLMTRKTCAKTQGALTMVALAVVSGKYLQEHKST